MQKIYEALQDKKILSVDIFDTLLFRCVKTPSDLFEKVAQLARQQGYLNKYWSDCDFKCARMEVERMFYKEGVEPTLDGIYERMSIICGKTEQIKALELEVEMENCYRNDVIVALMRYAVQNGIIVVLTSDMYLSSEQVLSLLKQAEVPADLIDQVFMSCEKGASKKDGGLYDIVLEYYHVTPRDVLHIGDNSLSDVKKALERGIDAYHYNIGESENLSLMMDQIMLPSIIPELYHLRRWIASTLEMEDRDQKRWMLFGLNNLGPFFTYAMEWVLDVLEENHIHQIYPMMREGELYYAMLCQALEWRDYSVDMDLFYSSRNSMFLNQVDIVDADWIQSVYGDCCKEEVNVYGLFQLLQIEDLFPGELEEIKEKYLNVLHPEQKKGIIDYLSKESVLENIKDKVDLHKENTLRYLNDMGMQKQRFVTLDFGYKATAQSIIEKMLQREEESEHTESNIHLLLLQSNGAFGNINKGVDIKGYVSMGAVENSPFSAGCRDGILEALQMRGTGCTVGYSSSGEPELLEVVGIDKAQFQHIQWIHDGILYFQSMALPVLSRCPALKQIKDRSTELYKLMCRCVLYPTKEEADMISTFSHEDTFGNMLITKVMSYGESNCEDASQIFDIKYDGRYRPWHPGMAVCHNPLFYVEHQTAVNGERGELSLINAVKKALKDNVKSVVIAGSGLAGERMYCYCQLAGINVEAFTDGNKKLHSTKKYGLPVMGIADVEKAKCFLVASIKYREEIQKEIFSIFGNDIGVY